MGLSATAGSGDTIAVVDAYGYEGAESDLATYRSYFGLPACTTANGCFRKVDQLGGSNYPESESDWDLEQALDLDTVSALCPNCHILLVEAKTSSSSDLSAAEQRADLMGANQISNSYAGYGPASEAPPVSDFSFSGVSVVAASGDWGYDEGPTHTYWPAALPSVTAAGGTTLNANSSPGGRGFTESVWSGTGSGCAEETKPAWQKDSGCTGRAYNDVAADADPNTGLAVYDSEEDGFIGVGGTSLATPEIAAYYALVGHNAGVANASWDYANSSFLNDVTTGSNGSCSAYPPADSYICAARAGYDGPTGNGSINGAVIAGAPGIGGPGAKDSYVTAFTSTTASLSAGVYPNQEDTSYWWEYGPTTSYGASTASVDAGSGTSPVGLSTTLTGLSSATYYHYRLVAENSSGTTYGYDYVLTTSSTPIAVSPPSISGTTTDGHTLTASTGSWAASGSLSYAYQWWRCNLAGSTCNSIAGATASTYVLSDNDVGETLHVVVTASNGGFHASASSNATAAIAGVAPTLSSPWSPVSLPKKPPFTVGEDLYGVSCPTTAFCVAVAESGNVLTSSNPLGGANAWTVTNVDGNNGLDAVSCPTTSFCAATDFAGNVLTSTNPAGGAGSWTVTDVDGSNALLSISCPSASLCVASGGSDDASLFTSTNPTGGASAWTQVAVGHYVQSMSCPSTSLCVAGDNDGDILTSTNPTGGSGAWSTASVSGSSIRGISCPTTALCVATSVGVGVITSTNPTGGAGAWSVADVDAGNVLYGVSCSTASLCVASDGAGNIVTATAPTGGTGAWTAAHVDGSNTIPAVACQGVTLCVAADAGPGGDVVTSATPTAGSSAWTVSQVDGHDPLYAVSCGAANLCAAVDWAGNVRVATDPTGGPSAWVSTHLVAPLLYTISCYSSALCVAGSSSGSVAISTAPAAGAAAWHVFSVDSGNFIASMSCPSASLCVGGDLDGDIVTSKDPAGGASSWSVSHVDAGNEIVGMSCPSASLCVGVDSAGDVLSSTNPSGGASAWSVGKVDTNPIMSVSCPSTALCVASDSRGDIVSSPNPTGGPGFWDASTIDGSRILYSVSCASTTSCTAVDNDGNVLLSSNPAAGSGAWTAEHVYSGAYVPNNGLYSVSCPSTTFCAASGDTPSITVSSALVPTISGVTTDGQTLTANTGSWSGSGPISYSYQWRRCDSGGEDCQPISQATASTYKLADADAGETVAVSVTASNSAGEAEANSVPTGVIAPVVPTNTAAPTISGEAAAGQTLTTSNGTFAGGALSYAYQWQRCEASGANCAPVERATASTYKLTGADVGHELESVVTATNAAGHAEGISTATTAVAADPVTVSAITPAQGPTTGSTAVTIEGSGFLAGTAVNIGGEATSVQVVSETEIRAETADHTAGPQEVVVSDEKGTSTGGPTFTYIPAPTVTKVEPSSGPAAGGMAVTITGTNLTGASAVKFAGVNASTVKGETPSEIIATSPAGSGTVNVTVTTPGGTSAESPADHYTYIPAPTVTKVEPSSGPAAGGTTVTITGSGFVKGSTVTIGSAASAVEVVSETELKAKTAAGVGTPEVVVSDERGTSTGGPTFTFIAAPTVTKVEPSSGPAAGGTQVTITGSGFLKGATVTISSAASTVEVVSETEITAKTAAGVGTPEVVVSDEGGTSSAGPKYTYIAAPTVTKVEPSSGPAAGGTQVTVTGTNLTGARAVKFAGAAATAVKVEAPSEIIATSPAGSGTVKVTVTTTGGTSAESPADHYTYIPAPTVTKVEPSSGPAAGGTVVTITGSGFLTGATVTIGSAASEVEVVSATEITAKTAAHAEGEDPVVVTDGGGTSSGSVKYTYIPAPTVTKLEPSSGPAGGGTQVRITGSNLAGASAVKFAGVSATAVKVESPSEIVATSPAGSGTVNVTVTTPGGTSAESSADHYTYIPAPTVTKVDPPSGSVVGGTAVTIKGSGFLKGSTVTIGSAASAVEVVSETELKAKTAAGAAGPQEVVVSDEGGSSTGGPTYTYIPVPTVTKVEPTSGPAAGGTTVTITGTNLTGASAVKFAGVSATAVKVESPSEAIATSPAGSGTVNVTVTTAGGQSGETYADNYTYIPAPSVTNVEPSSGPAGGGTLVTITGANLTGASAVKFAGVNATAVKVEAPSEIVATSPAGSGTVNVTVTTPGGTSAEGSADHYTYIPAPTVTKVEPSSGPTAGGTAVTITGSGFLTGATVTIGSVASEVEVVSEDEITAKTSAGLGTPEVVVSDGGGTSTGGPTYTYIPAPTVTKVDPPSGSVVGGTAVTIKGSGFLKGSTVTIGSAASAVEVVSETELKAKTAAGAAGPQEVVVSDEGGSSTGGPTYTYIAPALPPPPPTVEKVEPDQGGTEGGTTVTITGTNFENSEDEAKATGVNFGSTPAAGFTVKSDSSISAVAPPGAPGTSDVTVTTPSGASATSRADQFTYMSAPAASSESPAYGPVAGGTSATITGTGLASAPKVLFGSTPAIEHIANLKMTPATLIAAARGPSAMTATQAETGKREAGAIVSYIDTQSATTTFTVQRLVEGRRQGHSCVKPTKHNRSHGRCTRTVTIGAFTHADAVGANRFRFTGRVDGRKLAPESYRLRAILRNAAGNGPAVYVPFRVAPVRRSEVARLQPGR